MPTAILADPQVDYDREADEYQRALPPEHSMESTAQHSQQLVTSDSFTLLRRQRPDIYIFGELLVQYPKVPPRKIKPLGQVVPDNMVVVSDVPVVAKRSYKLPMQPLPLIVMEYVSETNPRKDYVENRRMYERELKVPYYVVFDPDEQDLILYHRTGGKYTRVKLNQRRRLPIPELDLELAIGDGWLRFWYRGELLLLPDEIADKFEAAEDEARQAADKIRQLEEQLRRLGASPE